MKKYIAALGILCGLTACESLRQEVDPALINAEAEKLVVACFISPQDTLLTAEVALSKPVLGENAWFDKRVDNATITLSDGQRSVVLGRRNGAYAGQYYYGADPKAFPIVAGQRYTLTVQIPDGRNVEAQCTVPRAVVPKEVLMDSIATFRNGYSGREYFVRATWTDPAGEENFYRLAGTYQYLFLKPDYPNAPEPSWQSSLIDFRRNNDTGDLTDDRLHDGELLSSSRGFLSYSVPLAALQHASCTVDLLQIDANYYRYHEAVLRQSEAGQNPFAEPVLIPTNIVGGLGCFGASNRSTITFTMK
ncbi:hypothetical protein GCM10027299_19960 [Larkinella ripae]